MSDVEICAELAEKGYKPWEIDLLDRWWIAHIIFHPRGQKGVPHRVIREAEAVQDAQHDGIRATAALAHPRASTASCTIRAKPSAFNDAPPTSAPSTSGSAKNSAALSGVQLPP